MYIYVYIYIYKSVRKDALSAWQFPVAILAQMLMQKPHLGFPQSWLRLPFFPDQVPDIMADDADTLRWRSYLQTYLNGCKQDCDIFDLGSVYGVIDRGKGVQAKQLLAMVELIECLLKMSSVAKVVKGELQNVVIDIMTENPRRSILTNRSRDEASRYVTTQVQLSPHIWKTVGRPLDDFQTTFGELLDDCLMTFKRLLENGWTTFG